jgi:endonuclease YncB( thermonuclease family)
MKSSIRIILPIVVAVFSLVSAAVYAAPMVRAVRAVDGTTLEIDDAGSRRTIRLAGVEVPPGYSPQSAPYQRLAADALTRAVAGRWVMVEEDGGAGAYVYRSPDAWFVNREMIRLGIVLMAREPFSRSSEFLDAERSARAQGAGYWSAAGSGELLASSGHVTYLGLSDPAPSKPGAARTGSPRPAPPKATQPSRTVVRRRQRVIVLPPR